ncbi:cytochrome P450 family protein [Pseudonocardia humida]|uniref:Cytochrome P450 n=1 Tax=Pseudonocardia humida TaxID=2800819 RepID=A0ABT0ZTI9_9PSEU|nr:cytochrome P450 [Pseudonocardia humida]MCO1653999.1 cytochrome P450 [Pseudonocardia humida]
MSLPEIDFTDPATLTDPPGVHGRARERSTVARLLIPGMPMHAVLRHEHARAVLADPRFELSGIQYQRPRVDAELEPYLRSLQEMDGAEHARLRGLVAPAFGPRAADRARPRIRRIVDGLLDSATGRVTASDPVDLVTALARPLPMAVICELVGIPEADRPRWHSYGEVFATGQGGRLGEIIPEFVADAKAAVAHRRADPGDDLLSDLVRARTDDGDRLTDVEVVGLVWQVVLGGQTPTHLVANGVAQLLRHPDQLAALRADPELMPGAVEELMRWCGPQLLSFPRYAREDAEIDGVPIAAGEAVVASIVAANRDPRAFDEPETLDVTRRPGRAAHLGFAHGPHFCLGAGLARAQAEVAIAALLERSPGLALAVPAEEIGYVPDPATWRLAALPVRL